MRVAVTIRIYAVAFLTLGVATGLPGQVRPKPIVDTISAMRLFDEYERGAVLDARFADPRSLMSSLQAAGPGWVDAVPEAGRAQRRQLAAMVALETVAAWTVSGSAQFLEWGCDLMRHGQASDFEHDWMLASTALLESVAVTWGQPAVAMAHVDHAASRFPTDSRFPLARLLLRPEAFTLSNRPGVSKAKLEHSVGRGKTTPFFMIAPHIDDTSPALAKLVEDPVVGPEARMHLGLLHFLLGHVAASVSELKAAGAATDDSFIKNLAWLGAGLALDAQGQRAEATEAYRNAVQAIPAARASATQLALHFFLAGQRAEASALLDAAYGTDPPARDPWQRSVAPDRFLPDQLARLRTTLGLTNPAPAWHDLVEATATLGPTREETQVLIAPQSPNAPRGARDPGVAAPVNDRPAVASADARAASDQPTFRSAATAVIVDVAVRAGKNPAAGLAASDFEVLDNGVRQSVEAISVDAVPLDVTLIVDLSDALYQFPGEPLVYPPAQSRADLVGIAALLRPTDRLRDMVVYMDAREVLPLRPVADIARDLIYTPQTWQYDETAAINDAAAAALLRSTPAGRRHLVIMFTDGIDGTSVVPHALLLEAAQQSDAVLHLARRLTFGEEGLQRSPRSSNNDSRDLLWPAEPFRIEDVARATGGTVRRPRNDESIVSQAKQILDEFRQSYILQYRPAGVSATGWHQLAVRVTKAGKFDVKARRGYFAGPG